MHHHASGAGEHTNRSVSDSPCTLCPRMCGAIRSSGNTGYCNAPDEMYVARAALHHWEEPPLSGEAGSGTIFFTHCPLRCVYCQNRVIAEGLYGIPVTERDLAVMCLNLQSKGALNVNFVTPTHYTLKIVRAICYANENGLDIPVVWNTSGYERLETIRLLDDSVDVFLADFKYASSSRARRYSNAADYPEIALRALKQMALQTGEASYDEVDGQPRMLSGVIVRHMLLPGSLDDSKRALEMLWSEFGTSVEYSIMNQYTPVMNECDLLRYPELREAPRETDYEELLDYADSLGISDYYWQQGGAAEESFIPKWDGAGVVTSNR